MYNYLNSSLKLSDIVRGLSYQQSYCNLSSLYKLIIIIPFILQIFTFSIHIMFSIIPSDANNPQRLMRRLAPNKQTNTSPSQDTSTHQIWNLYLKEYRGYAPDSMPILPGEPTTLPWSLGHTSHRGRY